MLPTVSSSDARPDSLEARHEVSPVPAGEPTPCEVLSGVRNSAGASVHELRYAAASWGEILLRMRDACQHAELTAGACLTRGLHAEAPCRTHPYIEGGTRG